VGKSSHPISKYPYFSCMIAKLLFRGQIILVFALSLAFEAKAQFSDAGSFRNGFYYDLQGVKHVGLIRFKVSKVFFLGSKTKVISSFLFKTDPKAEKQTIEAVNTKSVVALADSFISHIAFRTDKKGRKVMDTTTIFMRVELSNNGHNIYSIEYGLTGFQNGAATSFTDTVIYIEYCYGDNLDNAAVINEDNFVEIMCNMLKDSPTLVEKIKAKKYTLMDVGGLIFDYKKEKEIPMNKPDFISRY
jgi:hypothetical protein